MGAPTFHYVSKPHFFFSPRLSPEFSSQSRVTWRLHDKLWLRANVKNLLPCCIILVLLKKSLRLSSNLKHLALRKMWNLALHLLFELHSFVGILFYFTYQYVHFFFKFDNHHTLHFCRLFPLVQFFVPPLQQSYQFKTWRIRLKGQAQIGTILELVFRFIDYKIK